MHHAVVNHLKLERQIGGYAAQTQAQAQIERFYTAFAALLNCDPSEIAYAENATRAWDMVFYAIPFASGDRILTAQAEYASNYLAYLQVRKRLGVSVEVIPNDEYGQISVDALEKMIDDRVRLISITHVPTQGGLVNPAAAVGGIAKQNNTLYLLDACQSVGQMHIDVQEIGCDMLTGTGRKYLRGPRGTGFLYVRESVMYELEPPFIDLHAATWISRNEYRLREDARRFENWESYVAGRIGLATAVDYALGVGLKRIEKRVQRLAAALREQLAAVPGVQVHDQGKVKCGIVTLTKEGETAVELQQRLQLHNIDTSVSRKPSARLDFAERGINELLRASLHYYNTDEEIAHFVRVLRENKQS